MLSFSCILLLCTTLGSMTEGQVVHSPALNEPPIPSPVATPTNALLPSISTQNPRPVTNAPTSKPPSSRSPTEVPSTLPYSPFSEPSQLPLTSNPSDVQSLLPTITPTLQTTAPSYVSALPSTLPTLDPSFYASISSSPTLTPSCDVDLFSSIHHGHSTKVPKEGKNPSTKSLKGGKSSSKSSKKPVGCTENGNKPIGKGKSHNNSTSFKKEKAGKNQKSVKSAKKNGNKSKYTKQEKAGGKNPKSTKSVNTGEKNDGMGSQPTFSLNLLGSPTDTSFESSGKDGSKSTSILTAFLCSHTVIGILFL